ncbi:MAG TPA: hypothetical protein VK107_05330 [Alloiococcus sp.]|nr:hypothetical protein [Alloiococcus sp.]
MLYLTYNEYMDLGFAEIEETEFDKLIKKAGDVLDNVTRFFYKQNVLENDVDFRKEQFKKAVAAQVEYFHDMGATNSHGLNEPGTVTIGRTTVSKGTRNSSQHEQQNSIVSDDVYMHLEGTGLLYRGIGVV